MALQQNQTNCVGGFDGGSPIVHIVLQTTISFTKFQLSEEAFIIKDVKTVEDIIVILEQRMSKEEGK